jgi:hypothetical protein
LFLSESVVEPVIAWWIVSINVFDAVPGEYSVPKGVMRASKGVPDDSIVKWFTTLLAYLGRYSWLVGFSYDGERCLVRCFLRHVATMLLATDRSPVPVQLVEMPIHCLLFSPEVFVVPSSWIAATG